MDIKLYILQTRRNVRAKNVQLKSHRGLIEMDKRNQFDVKGENNEEAIEDRESKP